MGALPQWVVIVPRQGQIHRGTGFWWEPLYVLRGACVVPLSQQSLGEGSGSPQDKQS